MASIRPTLGGLDLKLKVSHAVFRFCMKFDPSITIRTLSLSTGKQFYYHSIFALEEVGIGPVSRLPICMRMLLENVIRNFDGYRVTEDHIYAVANWSPQGPHTQEIPFLPARIILQDFTGVPLLVDLATMRSAVEKFGLDPSSIEPLIPVDLVIDHSVQVDFSGSDKAFLANLEMELARNRERYQFLKWGMQAFKTFRVIPPAIGIIHQVNLEYIAQGVWSSTKNGSNIVYPDSVLGTDSHTTMINGLGIVGWGVGGIEAEACMLGQPTFFLIPAVVGVYLKGTMHPNATATDLALTVTQILRQMNVVGKFVEFFGPGAATLPVADRAVVANMAPEYGATMGFFPPDEASVEYLRQTGRFAETCELFENYYKAQGMWGIPKDTSQVNYSSVIEVDLSTIKPCIAGPKRPQDRIELKDIKQSFISALIKPVLEGGYGKRVEEVSKVIRIKGSHPHHHHYCWEIGTRKATVEPPESEMRDQHPAPDDVVITKENLRCNLRHGSIVLAAITSCTNTSNPALILAAALLAKKAAERGLIVPPSVKTSFAPGSRVVTEYLRKTGLQKYFDALGFHVVGYGCTTCIGNSGPIEAHIEDAITENDLIVVAVLSGNRNFEGRVHQLVHANYLMSPPLVIAFALAGRIDIDLTSEPLGYDREGKPVFLHELWPSPSELNEYLELTTDPQLYRQVYQDIYTLNPKWLELQAPSGKTYQWDPTSTYIQKAPYFENFTMEPTPPKDIRGARCLAILGDSITTDHISPAGTIKKDSPAGKFLIERGVPPHEFNSYGARRGNHEIMMRGTFANARLKNLMLGGEEGGFTYYFGRPGEQIRQKTTIYDAAMQYKALGVPTIIFAGREYGTGSSRDWAAKGPALLGIKAIIAKSFERIHRSNLIGMGVLPIELPDPYSYQSLGLNGSEVFDIVGIERIYPNKQLTLRIMQADSNVVEIPVRARLDTPVEVEYYIHGGILPYMLRQILSRK